MKRISHRGKSSGHKLEHIHRALVTAQTRRLIFNTTKGKTATAILINYPLAKRRGR